MGGYKLEDPDEDLEEGKREAAKLTSYTVKLICDRISP